MNSKLLIKPLRIKIIFKFKSFHFFNFKFLCPKILSYLNKFSIQNNGFASLPKKFKRITVLRSPHVDKKSREQFEIKSSAIILTTFFDLTNHIDRQKAKLLINFIQNSTGGLSLKIIYKMF